MGQIWEFFTPVGQYKTKCMDYKNSQIVSCPKQAPLMTRDVKLGIQICQIGPKGTNLGLFKLSFSTFHNVLVLKLIFKKVP